MRTLNKVIIVLIFILAGVLFFHNLTSVNVDIGRHIKLGEIIWEMKEVPKTNLLSFTESEHVFINHHWLSEVVFYKIYSLGGDWITGLRLLMVSKTLVLLAVYCFLFLTVKKHNIFSIVFAFLVSVFVFSARTEPRPEIFSYLIFSAYLFILYKAKSTIPDSKRTFKIRTLFWLWFLPILQVFWVNLHIYFIMGPILFLFFLIDEAINRKNWKSKIGIFILVVLSNFINPNFIKGALYPFTVLGNYGYSIVENSSLFFLAEYFGRWAPQDKLFLISLFILVGSFVLWFWKRKKLTTSNVVNFKTRVFDLLLMAMTVILSFKMQRNIPLFALSLWPVMSENLGNFFNFEFQKLKKWFTVGIIFILTASIYLVISNQFYGWLGSAKIFGWSVSSAAQDGTDFIKSNKIQGPVFNNFDIGNYLAWQLFPEQRVFVDGRPEAYSVEFFDKIYKPMQRDEKIWEEKSKEYNLNYVFFAHTDITEWGYEFLEKISKNEEWPIVFLNDAVVIFLKNTDSNRSVINQYMITEQNIRNDISKILDRLDKKNSGAFVNYGNILYRFGWLESSARVFEALIENQPDNPYGYQGAAYAYAVMNDEETQEKAVINFEKAIDLGFKTFNNYFTLGIIYANRKDFFEAEDNLIKALKINPNNQNARDALKMIENKLRGF